MLINLLACPMMLTAAQYGDVPALTKA